MDPVHMIFDLERDFSWMATSERLIEPLLTELCGCNVKLVPGQNCQVTMGGVNYLVGWSDQVSRLCLSVT